MAERKQFENVPAPSQEVLDLLRNSRDVTEDELREQRVSFAFGNARFSSEHITKDSVRVASEHIRLMR